MRLISKVLPTPRLLSTVVPELRVKPPERVSMRSRIKSVSLFTGNGRAIFLGLIAGAVLICAIGVLYRRHEAARQHTEEQRKLLAVSTQSISHPEPIVIKISADLIHVSNNPIGVDEHDAVLKTLDNRLRLALFINQPIDIELFELLQPFGHLLNSEATV